MWVEYLCSTHIILSYNDLENFYIPDQCPGTTYRVYKKLFGLGEKNEELPKRALVQHSKAPWPC